ncbi:hypothetical protein NAP1_06745 [Erythrobacter sp. NAP1]|uniref:hypothetical protein n=1 Tax=Erythrobacter sp. NAP1 TaxID=237727 RepID=UPI0000686959|nr:hypothetical protein [Erythrobacter sp. NAP1]EAQ30455.1 hypothetical protein NAP1_06745 [Erythrobacter sp. NAP1]
MKEKIALYSLGIGIFVLGSVIYDHLVHGEAIQLGRLWLAVLLLPVLSYFIWLRWDWAPKEGRERSKRERQAAKEFRRQVEAEKAAAAAKDRQ